MLSRVGGASHSALFSLLSLWYSAYYVETYQCDPSIQDVLLRPEERNRPSHKLQLKLCGPFKIQKKVTPNAYRLVLPRTIRAHPVFNVAALKKYNANQLPGRVQPAPPPLTDMDGHTRYIVEKLLSHNWTSI